jgi:hypothetical protein
MLLEARWSGNDGKRAQRSLISDGIYIILKNVRP